VQRQAGSLTVQGVVNLKWKGNKSENQIGWRFANESRRKDRSDRNWAGGGFIGLVRRASPGVRAGEDSKPQFR